MTEGFVRVSRRMCCPVCGKADWCLVSRDGKTVLCPRVSSEKWSGTKGGGWVHRLSENYVPPPHFAAKIAPANTIERREREVLDKVYRTFLAELKLSNFHRQLLRERGFSDDYITRAEFKTFPHRSETRAIAARFHRRFNLAGVPGFFEDENGFWDMITFGGASGFLIPILNQAGQIEALQLRRDDYRKPKYLLFSSAKIERGRRGSPSGAPAHFAVPENTDFVLVTEIIVTEGALKARVISHLSGRIVIGLVSTTCFDDSLPHTLRETFPALRKVSIAYDMDSAHNAHVRFQRDRLAALLLEEGGIEVFILDWDQSFKGLDDYLLSLSVSSQMQKVKNL